MPAFARGFASSGLAKDEVTNRVLSVVKNFQNVDQTKVAATSHFMKDLGLDSLDTVEVIFISTSRNDFCCVRASVATS